MNPAIADRSEGWRGLRAKNRMNGRTGEGVNPKEIFGFS